MKESFLKGIYTLYPVTGIVATLLLAFLLNFVSTGNIFSAGHLSLTTTEGYILSLQMVVYLFLAHGTIAYFNSIFKQDKTRVLRYCCEITFLLSTGYFLHKGFHWLIIWLSEGAEREVVALERKVNQQVIYSVCALMVMYTFLISSQVLRLLQQKQSEIINWHQNILQSQFEALKNQLNPHFLFSSLTSLTSLVYENPAIAEEFIQKLSQTYRYLLDHSDKQSIELEHELHFLSHYEFILKQRFGSKIQIRNDISSGQKGYWLPPHTIMLLSEYIIGANKMSARTPIRIELSLEQEMLLIKHNLSPKPDAQSPGEDERLKALNERYCSFKRKNYKIVTAQEDGYQIIRIPLFTTAHDC